MTGRMPWRSSTTRAPGPASARTSASLPAARIRPPPTARAGTTSLAALTVWTPLRRRSDRRARSWCASIPRMRSDGWLETYRGTVFRWEVDANDHFTVAYYLARFGDAATALLHTLGLDPAPTLECYIRYSRELRVGDLLHVERAVIAVEPARLTLGPQLLGST